MIAAASFFVAADPSAGAVAASLSHPSDASRFGWAVDVDGDTIVVGAPGIGNGQAVGRAFVYRRSGSQFLRVAELIPSDSAPKDGFGHSVAVNSHTIIVGSANASGLPGKAYVFDEPAGGWAGDVAERARLAPAAGASARFGASVGVSAAAPRTVAVGDEDYVFVFVALSDCQALNGLTARCSRGWRMCTPSRRRTGRVI